MECCNAPTNMGQEFHYTFALKKTRTSSRNVSKVSFHDGLLMAFQSLNYP